ncbi:hypothetical protein OG978_14460 [Streptomyces sp. NBC_01591]|uniref:hypothetical protein n=1 Tax=Streptomyces sp. NBC_01591 TaxID=2975888 RepID=UPI002DDACD80|nr:hypothetical protein [Streptomyces sp. NBC_01591]WSD68500.1 hypothetical protein OG978_14460 [Streptomyces sp. NBC_01591]
MSDAEPVDPVGIPVFTGDLALLDTKVTALSGHGAAIATAAGDVHSSFGGLSAFYKAPEAEQLFATTRPVAATGLSLSSDLCVIAGALSTYSDDAFPLVEKLKELKRDAVAFRVRAEGDDEWREDGDLVEENNRRRSEIAEVWTAFQEVERACHAKIVALVGGKALKIDDGSGKKEGVYGYDAEALKQAKSLPWGEAVEESTPWWQVWEHAYDFGKGFLVDGVWGTLKGLGTLAGFEGGDAAKEAWTGLAKLATGLSPAAMLVLHALPGDHSAWIRDSQTAVKETGKALIAWDQWGSNPSRAAGAVTFNVLTTVFTGGTGGAAAGAGKAGLAAKALSLTSKTARAVDPMTYVFKGAGVGLRRIGDVMAGLKGLGHVEFPPLPDHVITLPEGTLRLPDGTLRLPEGATVPEGATTLPDGTVKLPDNAVALPEGTVRSPFDEGASYLDRHGNLYNEDGTLAQRADQAGTNPHTQTPDPIREPALTGAGARTGDDAIHLGNDLGDLGRPGSDASGGSAGNHLPGSGPHHAPGGGVGDNTPSNHLDSNAPSGRSGGNGPAHHTGPSGTGPTAGHDLHTGSGHPGPPGTGGRGGGTHIGDSAIPPQRQPVPRPSFMRDGANPYGPRNSLTREQIEEIQVHRANEEPGYFERYYRKDGTRIRVERNDASGFAPPQLTRLSEHTPWIRAKDVPAPPTPHYLDEGYVSAKAETVKSKFRLKILEEATRKRHFAIRWDNLVTEWKAEAARAHEAQGTFESAGLWGEAKGTYKESHTQMGHAAEEFGEKVAEYHYMAEQHPGFQKEELLGPNSGNDQFDQIWTHEDGRVVVIEAKSSTTTELGRRTLPNGKQVSQGSKEYFSEILKLMEKRGETKLVDAIERVLGTEKLEYVVVKGEKNSGTYNGYRYRRFDISKGTIS